MKNVAFNYSNTPISTQFKTTATEELRVPLANEVTSIGKLIQQLKSEVNQLKSKLNQTDRLLVQKEIYAQNLKKYFRLVLKLQTNFISCSYESIFLHYMNMY